MSFHVIIPARYQSSRLPAKPLAMIGGKSMIEHVCDRASESEALSVSVATDHIDIFKQVEKAGYKAIMTKLDHPSGSDRIFEAAQALQLNGEDIIVNVQGDEPFIPPTNINQVALLLKNKTAEMATLCCKINKPIHIQDPDTVKVVFDNNHHAIYFSRSPIPYCREDITSEKHQTNYFRHIGIYAYRYDFLEQYINWPPSALEQIEKLEQLRVLSQGHKIMIGQLDKAPQAGVDNAIDLEQANKYYQSLLIRE